MAYAHKSNINYKMTNLIHHIINIEKKIKVFYEEKYKSYREKLESIDFFF